MKKSILINFACLFILFSCFLNCEIHAQPSGYMGKRLIAGYDISLIPSLSYPNRNLTYGLNDIHALYGEYILSKHTSIKASLSFFKTGFSTSNDIYLTYGEGFNTNTYIYKLDNNRSSLIDSRSFEIGPKWYVMHMAPVGFYWNLFIGLRNSGFKDNIALQEDSRHIQNPYDIDDDPYYYKNSLSFEMERINEFIVGAEGGIQRILYDRIALKMGVAFRSFWGKGPAVTNPLDYEDEMKMSIEEKLHYETRKRLFHHSAIAINFGIGYLF
jgi:hypothetical protein